MSPSHETLVAAKKRHFAACPPQASYEIMGYIQDENGEGYSRDIGRSFQLGGRTYYLFGDTFCKKDGEHVGLQNNTYAILPDIAKPTQSKYLNIKDDGLVEPLIEFTVYEKDMMEQSKCERITLWGFGGIVEYTPGFGFHFYQKGIIWPDGRHSYEGVGLATIDIDRPTGRLEARRSYHLLFGPDEPKVGSFSCVKIETELYLYGDYKGAIILARVEVAHAKDRSHYRFWDGLNWVEHWRHAAELFRDIPQGAIIYSDLFGPARPWVFVGCSKWADSKILVGAAAELTGPWHLTPVAKAQGIDQPKKWMYCIYPHAWTLHETEPEIMVTWSEHWPGGVVAAKLKFDKAEELTLWKE